jgi:hypothetical protein
MHEDEMGKTCGTCGKKTDTEFVGNPDKIRQLWKPKCRLGNDIKLGLKEICWERLEWVHLAQRPVAWSCEHGNEPFGSIKSM